MTVAAYITDEDILLERERRRRAARATAPPPPTFRGDNARAQVITDPAWIVSGPAETGKTFAALTRLDAEARRVPGGQFALVRKVRATMDGTVLNTWRRIIALRGGVTPFGGERPQWYDYPNGARVWVGGLDDPGKILSGERDGIYVNQAEELTQADWETLTSRATGRGAVTDTPMVWGDCNPGPADHWIKRLEAARALTLLVTTHRDNPTLYDEAGRLTAQGERTMLILSRMHGARKLRLRDGLWVGVEGQYFTQWDEDRHVIAPFAVPADWRIWGGFDYGFAHNTAFYLLTEHDGQVYVIGEHVAHRWLVQQHAPAMRALLARVAPWRRLEDLDVVAGHDVFAQKGDAQAQTIAQQYAAHGVKFRMAQIDRISGAQALAERLGNPEADLPPSLFVFRSCPRLISTIPALPTDPRRAEDVLKIDADDEGMGGDDPYDAVRYALMEAGRPPAPAPWSPAAIAALSSKRKV